MTEPATEPAVTTPAEPAPASEPRAPGPLDASERKKHVSSQWAALRGKLAEKTAAIDVVTEPAPGATAEPDKPADGEPAAEPEDKPEPAAAEPADDDDGSLELELVKARRQLADASDDAREAKAEVKALREKLAGYEKGYGEEARKKLYEDPVHALDSIKQIFGRDFGELSKWFVENKEKLANRQRYADVSPEIRAELEEARKEREERRRQAEAAQQQQALATYAGKVQQYLTENADEYPLASAYDWAAQDLAAQHGIGRVRPEHIAEFEKLLRANLQQALSNERALKHLTADEKIAAVLSSVTKQPTKPAPSPAVASPANGTPAPADGQRGLGNSSPGTAVRDPSKPVDRRQLILDELKRMRAQAGRQ